MRCNLGNAAVGNRANHCTFYVKAEGVGGPDRKAAFYTVVSTCADHSEHTPERSTLLKIKMANRRKSRERQRSSAAAKQTPTQPVASPTRVKEEEEEEEEVDEDEDSQMLHETAPAQGMLAPLAEDNAQSVVAEDGIQSVIGP